MCYLEQAAEQRGRGAERARRHMVAMGGGEESEDGASGEVVGHTGLSERRGRGRAKERGGERTLGQRARGEVFAKWGFEWSEGVGGNHFKTCVAKLTAMNENRI